MPLNPTSQQFFSETHASYHNPVLDLELLLSYCNTFIFNAKDHEKVQNFFSDIQYNCNPLVADILLDWDNLQLIHTRWKVLAKINL